MGGELSTDAATATRIVGWQHAGIAYLSSAPAMIIVAVFLAFPMLFAAWQSLYDVSPLNRGEQPFVHPDPLY